MKDKMQYYVLKEKAVPEVLLKVVEAKRLIDSGKIASVQEATESVGISRSSFYKYKDDIFPFHETTKGKTITTISRTRNMTAIRITMGRACISTTAGSISTGGTQLPPDGGIMSSTANYSAIRPLHTTITR